LPEAHETFAMSNPKSTLSIAGHPLHPMIVPLAIGFYFGVFGADLVYAHTADLFWARMAFWLLAAGFVMSSLASLGGSIDFIGDPAIRQIGAAWWHFGGNALVGLVSATDLYLRYVDGAETGSHNFLWMSALVAVLLIFTGWMGGQMVFKYRVGVRD
jgi:uncharacterized membrane protein